MPRPTQIRALLRTARSAARDVGELVQRRHRPSPQAARRKGVGDFVTDTDLSAERRLRRTLLAAYPEHGFLGEETAAVRPDAEFVWVVDPIDGTSNFARGLPLFAVSVACLHRGAPVAAAVWCSPEAVVYSAGAALGAFRGHRRITIPSDRLDDGAVVGAQWHRGAQANLAFVRTLVDTGARIRVFGSTVTELCDVAMGRLTANVQEQGKLWDFAAAGLIVLEAGGRFSDWLGTPVFPVASIDANLHTATLAAAPRIHRQLVAALG